MGGEEEEIVILNDIPESEEKPTYTVAKTIYRPKILLEDLGSVSKNTDQADTDSKQSSSE
jgi:hypothetical protein